MSWGIKSLNDGGNPCFIVTISRVVLIKCKREQDGEI